jgi:phosphonopyruvate decarboxylase
VVTGSAFATLLHERGFAFAAGVPCSLIESLISTLEHDARLPYVPSVREDVAVGLAAGAWLAGKRPVVLMQNSGLGTSMNALASMALMYGIPMLLVVTWRGYQGKDAPEHILTGEITPRHLALMGIPHRVLSEATAADDVAWAAAEMDRLSQPVAVLVPPGIFGGGHGHSESSAAGHATAAPRPMRPARTGTPTGELGPATISRFAAIAAAVKQLGSEPVVHANGYPSRESHAVADRALNFYMIGSMGLASAIGLGLSLARPAGKTIVFDGDGNLLMNFGILAMAGGLRPRNLVHVVFDNEVYGSTGGQRSPSRETRLDRLALGAGYRTVTAATTPDEIALALRSAADGPHFVLVKVTTEESPAPRIPHTPRAIRDRFRSILSG